MAGTLQIAADVFAKANQVRAASWSAEGILTRDLSPLQQPGQCSGPLVLVHTRPPSGPWNFDGATTTVLSESPAGIGPDRSPSGRPRKRLLSPRTGKGTTQECHFDPESSGTELRRRAPAAGRGPTTAARARHRDHDGYAPYRHKCTGFQQIPCHSGYNKRVHAGGSLIAALVATMARTRRPGTRSCGLWTPRLSGSANTGNR